jgi:hypothetical protein
LNDAALAVYPGVLPVPGLTIRTAFPDPVPTDVITILPSSMAVAVPDFHNTVLPYAEVRVSVPVE